MVMDLLREQFVQHAFAATFLVGIICPLIGVMVLIMRLSFIGVAMSHAAFAGALLGLLLNQDPLLFAFLLSFVAAGVLGPLADKGRLNTDASMGIVFSLTLGVSFLLLPLVASGKSEALRLLWGSVLTVTGGELGTLLAVTALVLLFLGLFFKEVQAVVFSRKLALACGIPATFIFYLILFLAGASIVASLKAIGGLLVFSMIINPAAAAYQLARDLKRMFLLAVAFGVFSGWLGLLLSCLLDLPTGAMIVLVSSGVAVLVILGSGKRARKGRDENEKGLLQRTGVDVG